MARVLLFGAAWMGLLVALAASVGLPAWPRFPRHEPSAAVSAVPRPPRAGARFPGWTVTRAYSAHQTMVIEVECDQVADARQIATQIVEPIRDRYDEVLIYIRRPGQTADDLPAERVQWTPRGGYVEARFGREP